MRTKLLILCYAVLLACSGKDDVPEGVLPQDKMVPILIDVYVAEGKVQNLRVPRDSAAAIFEAYEERIFTTHEVDRQTYLNSLTYYYDQPKKLELIYEIVLDSLNLREQRLKEVAEKTDDKKKSVDKKGQER